MARFAALGHVLRRCHQANIAAWSATLGPVLTALMVAGRVGAAFAAEIGTMRVTEQIDALRTLATHPVDYLVVPRLIGANIALPLLTIEAMFIGIASTPSTIDTRTLLLKDVTATGILSASPGLDAAIAEFASGTVDARPLVAATVSLDHVEAVLAGQHPPGGPGPKVHVDPRR